MRCITVNGCAAVALGAATLGWLGCAHRSSSSAPVGAVVEPNPGVKGEDLQGVPARQVEELLEGRVAGVRVVRLPRGGISLRLWGPSSIYGANEPLYVLDGMPLHVTPGHGLNWLNAGDILRIEILKDVSATALYGMRGANGVVLITTKRGHTIPR